MYNVDHTNLQGKVFKYCLVYLVLTSFQIYLTSYEYLNLLSVPIEKRQSISALSIAHHSMWNFLSMVLHLIMGLQIFRAFQSYLWLPVASLAVLHFSIQRKMMLEVWKAQNYQIFMVYDVYFNSERNRCQSKYYFFVFMMVIFMYQLFTVDGFLVAFFGTLWLPQILQYRKHLKDHSYYRLSPGYVLFTSLHSAFFPSYMRLCPVNAFQTEPHP